MFLCPLMMLESSRTVADGRPRCAPGVDARHVVDCLRGCARGPLDRLRRGRGEAKQAELSNRTVSFPGLAQLAETHRQANYSNTMSSNQIQSKSIITHLRLVEHDAPPLHPAPPDHIRHLPRRAVRRVFQAGQVVVGDDDDVGAGTDAHGLRAREGVASEAAGGVSARQRSGGDSAERQLPLSGAQRRSMRWVKQRNLSRV